MMKRTSELLYWVQFRKMIHYSKETNSYSYDPELPERARKSFEAWRKQF